MSIRAWTDLPILAFGDEEDDLAPIRECLVTAYDGKDSVVAQFGRLHYQLIPRSRVSLSYGRVPQVEAINPTLLALHFEQRTAAMKTYRLIGEDGTIEWNHNFTMASDEMAIEYSQRIMKKSFPWLMTGQLWRIADSGETEDQIFVAKLQTTSQINVGFELKKET